jgi:enterochelin esterase-like enzyme
MSGSMSSRVGNPLDEARNATPAQIEGMRSIRWYIECGDDDRLLQASVDFYNTLRGHDVPRVQFRVRNGGHNWEYWRGMLPTVLTFVSIGFTE